MLTSSFSLCPLAEPSALGLDSPAREFLLDTLGPDASGYDWGFWLRSTEADTLYASDLTLAGYPTGIYLMLDTHPLRCEAAFGKPRLLNRKAIHPIALSRAVAELQRL